MDSILDDLSEHAKKLYEERKFKEVEQMLTTFLREAESSSSNSASAASSSSSSEVASSKSLAKAYNNRGHAKYMQVEFDRALEDYDRALSIDPDLAVAYFNRGTIRYRMGKAKEAEEDFMEACKREPDNQEFAEGARRCKEEEK